MYKRLLKHPAGRKFMYTSLTSFFGILNKYLLIPHRLVPPGQNPSPKITYKSAAKGTSQLK